MFVSRASGQCMMVQGLSSAQGVPIVQSPCTVAGDQRWNFRQVGSNWQIVSNETGLCLMPNGGSATSGTGLVQGTCSPDSARVWSLRGNADGSFSVIGAASGLCVDLPAGASNGTPLRQSTCSSTSNANQNWRIETARTSLWDPIVSLPLIPVAAAMLPGASCCSGRRRSVSPSRPACPAARTPPSTTRSPRCRPSGW
ncbi:MAG TPA: RICIN domain-containing protein [Burkholderiaceae bacterium]|nr:RICIN domain-containing protein [Burkholderiaceae bacterium]